MFEIIYWRVKVMGTWNMSGSGIVMYSFNTLSLLKIYLLRSFSDNALYNNEGDCVN